jgi:hypothetical protein
MTDVAAMKEIGRRFREDLWNSGDLAQADELLSGCEHQDRETRRQ